MPDITVHPHGDRWAVLEAGAESPIKEFGTREAAELAARDLAGGGRVEVREDDPSGLAQDPRDGEPAARQEPDIAAVDAPERARSVQTGL
jgi:Uncharacterized protein conserved in bacteria (DUF2188)